MTEKSKASCSNCFHHCVCSIDRSMYGNSVITLGSDTTLTLYPKPGDVLFGELQDLCARYCDHYLSVGQGKDTIAAVPIEGHGSYFPLGKFIHDQKAWSEKTFGSGTRTEGILRHIEKEMAEIRQDPTDIMEWTDILLLTLDGIWRRGFDASAICSALVAKQTQNFHREWPAAGPQDEPNEHIKTHEKVGPISQGRIHVNQVYRIQNNFHKSESSPTYRIMGAWTKTVGGHCCLVRTDGKGHAYAGKMVHVKSVWDISAREFELITDGKPAWFRLVKEDES